MTQIINVSADCIGIDMNDNSNNAVLCPIHIGTAGGNAQILVSRAAANKALPVTGGLPTEGHRD